VAGFEIASFRSALAGALIVSIVSWLLNWLAKDDLDRRR
jgi:uncharacterized membrane protein YvlD (DUF360 family)